MNLPKLLWATRFLVVWSGRSMVRRGAPWLADLKLRWERSTGRGGPRDAAEAARYFRGVMADYEAVARHAGLTSGEGSVFAGRRVLELGPGDTLSVGLVARDRGAVHYDAYDRFDLGARDDEYLRAVYGALVEGGGARADALLRDAVVHHDPVELKRAGQRYDLVVSRSVLEHVDDLDALYATLRAVTTDDAVMIHKVDLRSHHNQHDHDLDFLMLPEGPYRFATTHVGMPNRVRATEYLALAPRAGFVTRWAARTHVLDVAAVESVRAQLAAPFRAMPVDDLRVLGLWLVQVGPKHPLAAGGARYLTAADLGDAPAEALAPF